MSSFNERMQAAADTMKTLLAQPFPREETPEDACAFESHKKWMGQAPGRLAALVGADYHDCDGSGDNGCETDTDASASHCGACGNVCRNPERVCCSGTCARGC